MRNFFAGLAACALVLCAGYALASRNSSGTMSAANGPYVPGTTISSSIINSRFADIENEITDSLSRSGKGGMTAPLKESDGTVAAPSFSFTSEPGSGLYRIGANDFGFSVNGAKKHEWTSTGQTVTGTLAVSGTFTGTGAAAFNGGATANSSTTGTSNTPAWTAQNTDGYQLFFVPRAAALAFNGITQAGDSLLSFDQAGSAGTGALVIAQHSAGSVGIRLNGTGVAVTGTETVSSTLGVTGVTTATGGLAIGGTGTAITASYQGSHSFTGTTISASSCNNTTTVTVTGTSAGDPCSPGTDSGFLATGIFLACATTTDGCIVQVCNASTSGQVVAGTTLKCRTWH